MSSRKLGFVGTTFVAIVVLLALAPIAAQAGETVAQSKAIAVERVQQAVEALPSDFRPPQRFALVIGVGQYRDSRIPDLPACANDARGLREVLVDPSAGMFPADHVALLVDDAVTARSVKDALDQLGRRAGPQDLVVVFFSGHGATDERGRAYWVMADSEIDKLRATALPESDVSDLLGDIKTSRLLTLIDACYSAATVNLGQTKSLVDLTRIYPEFQGDGRVAITASKGDQLSVVIRNPGSPEDGYSAFAWHVLQGLRGQGDGNQDGVVTVDELWDYVKDRTEQTARRQGGQQQPQLKGQIGSRFLLSIDAQRLALASEETQRRLATLQRMLGEGRITGAQFDEARQLLTSSADPGGRRKVYVDLADGRLDAAYLVAALEKAVPSGPSTPAAVPVAATTGAADRLKQLFLEGKLSRPLYDLGVDLLGRDAADLSRYDRDRVAEFQAMLVGRLKPEHLERALSLVETPEMEAQRKLQSRIDDLLARARANDSKEQGKVALAALNEVLKLDPDHAEGKRLRDKIGGIGVYYGPSKVDETITNSIGMKLTYIPAGEFMMGSPATEVARNTREKLHRIRISRAFLMGVTEVTQAQWQAVMGNNPSHFKGDDRPVEMVNWDEATEFCRRLSQKDGRTYRLPTEAEWEYACRAGTTTPFYFGATITPNQVNYNGNYPYGDAAKGQYRQQTTSVGGFPVNAWGLYDMHGNVYEWCGDWYGEYPSGAVTDPTGPANGQYRVVRGGSWGNHAWMCRAANGGVSSPGDRDNDVGFRVVCVLLAPGLSE